LIRKCGFKKQRIENENWRSAKTFFTFSNEKWVFEPG